jgi:hypothetical protein
MRARRALEIGLVVGAALGFFVRGSVVHAPTPAEVPTAVLKDIGTEGVSLRGYYRSSWDRARWAGADLSDVDLREAVLMEADLRGAILTATNLRGADLTGADLSGARLWECDLRRAKLIGTRLEGAVYDCLTRWPEGFDPQAHGARLDERPASERYNIRCPVE